MSTTRQYLMLLKRAARAWSQHNVSSMGAALAFYSAFAFAPLLIILSAVTGLLFGAERARHALLAQVRGLIGPVGSEAVQHLLDATSSVGTGLVASAIGVGLLLLGASTVMLELQHDLNLIWRARRRRGPSLWAAIRARLAALALILAAGLLLLLSLIVDTALHALVHHSPLVAAHALALHSLHLLLTLIILGTLFAMLFKWLPSVRLGWREVWLGAFVTALLFTVGQLGIGYYLGRSSTTSAYAAAASLLVLLLWLYYGAQIFLFGAELVCVYVRYDRSAASDRSPPHTPLEPRRGHPPPSSKPA